MIFLLSGNAGFTLSAQIKTIPIVERNINGIVRDSWGKGIALATVRLFSARDTLNTITNEYGVFIFRNVRSADFLLTIKRLDYTAFQQKYFNNDTKAQLILQPIVLRKGSHQLQEVNITARSGPQQRGDTTEFWAKDYIVRDFARLEDLLKRLEGVSIDKDGSLFYNGERVVKALFNGQRYFDGSVKDAIKELPADIVERVQIIDDYSEGTKAKGLKTEQSTKALNIVTKSDKSAGKMFNTTVEAGENERYSGYGSVKSIDAHQQYSSIFALYKNEPLGIRSGDPVGSISKYRLQPASSAGVTDGIGKNLSTGTTFNQNPGRLSLNHTYKFDFSRQRNSTESFSESFFEEGDLIKNISSNQEFNNYNHNWMTNYSSRFKNNASLYGSLMFDYKSAKTEGFNQRQQTGIIENVENEFSSTKEHTPSYNLQGSYTHLLNKKHTLTVQYNSQYKRLRGRRY